MPSHLIEDKAVYIIDLRKWVQDMWTNRYHLIYSLSRSLLKYIKEH